MIIDEYGCIVLEQCGWPGNIGDSCAETARYAHLQMLRGSYIRQVDLTKFITFSGYIRHPTAPDGWRESDFSSDQALPLYLALRRGSYSFETSQMERRLAWRTGNGDLTSPGLWCLLHGWTWVFYTMVALQALLFKFPYRWSDSKKAFERNDASVADYLNWVHCAVYCPKVIRKLVPKSILFDAIHKYYKPEINCERLLNLYNVVIQEYW